MLATWTDHHPNSQNAQIQTAVFQLPLKPLSTAADDAFAKAMQEASKEPTRKVKEPSPQPVALPVAMPVAKPVIRTTAVDFPIHQNVDSRTKKAETIQASSPADRSAIALAQPIPEPVDPDQRVKRRQQNLLGQWDRVLMFRAQFSQLR